MTFSSTLIEKFFARVRPSGECWVWTGAKSGAKGYGLFQVRNQVKMRAHRFSYLAFRGDIPDGLLIRHLCHVKGCVRPDHLTPGTHRQNLMDSRGRPVRRKRALTDEQVVALRNRYEAGETTTSLAQSYGIGISTAWRYAVDAKSF